MEEPDFPRGRPAPPEAKNDEAPKQKHRYNKRTTRDDAQKRVASDFLFGQPETKRKKAKKTTITTTNNHDTAATSRNTQKSSLLPMGGGGVVFPAAPSSKSSSANRSNTTHHKPAYIEGLSFSKLTKGMRLLGCVKEVYADSSLVVFSLPNLWTGYMMASTAKQPRDDNDNTTVAPPPPIVSIGQYLSVVIVKAVQEATKDGPKRRIQVSCLPSAVNAAAVSSNDNIKASSILRGQVLSAEDHGLLIDIGLGRRGFLKYTDIDGDYTVDDEAVAAADTNTIRILTKGRVDDFVLAESTSKDTKIVPLKLPSRVTMTQTLLTKTPTLASLQPGSLVRASVEAHVRNGLCVSFAQNVFRGAIEVSHLGCTFVAQQKTPNDDWKAIFQSHKHLTARVVAVDANSKIVRLSLLPHLLALQPPPPVSRFTVGSIVSEATVVRVDPGLGAVLALPADGDHDDEEMTSAPSDLNAELMADERYRQASRIQTVYVHISKAFDEQKGSRTSEAVFSKEFAPSTVHKVRLLSTCNLIDGMATGATAASVVNAHVLTHDDIRAGQVYRQVPVCAHVAGGGVLVDFGMGVRGLIPPLHLFDHTVTNDYRGKMYKDIYALGAKVDVRVLSVDFATKRCILTAKKALVKSKDIITSFDSVKIGQKTVGFVTKVDERGLSVTFFNGVYGRVTSRSIMVELGIENVKENYSVGDTVNCCVVNNKKRASRGKRRAVGGDEAADEDEGNAYWELTLSLKSQSAMDQEKTSSSMEVDNEQVDTTVPLQVGTILPLRSMRIIELKKGVEKPKGFVPGYAIVSIKTKYLIESAERWSLPEFIECKLPFDQLLDEYSEADVASATALDTLAEKLLTIGKKIGRRGIVLTDPRKTGAEYAAGTGWFTVVSIRPRLVEYFEAKEDTKTTEQDILLPTVDSHVYVGAQLLGYVAQVDSRHGAFVRFLDGLTGLVPKMKGGLDLVKFQTVVTRVIAIDVTSRPQKIVLGMPGASLSPSGANQKPALVGIDIGDEIDEVEVQQIDFQRASLIIRGKQGEALGGIRARLHHSMASSKPLSGPVKQTASEERRQIVSKYHPFFGLDTGSMLRNLRVAAIDVRGRQAFVELSQATDVGIPPVLFEKVADVTVGKKVTGIVASVDANKGGLYLQICPGITGFIPSLELSEEVAVLNNLYMHFPVGARLECLVIDKLAWLQGRSANHALHQSKDLPYLSFLKRNDGESQIPKPSKGDVVVGRINHTIHQIDPPALTLELRGGHLARCCITELCESDDWQNMPIVQLPRRYGADDAGEVAAGINDEDDSSIAEGSSDGSRRQGSFVACRVLDITQQLVDVSLRPSRLEGDLDDDEIPEVDQLTNAYVVDTNKKGCFLRLSRQTEGRAMLKEMCDGFLPDPRASFPAGRLVVGKVKSIRRNKGKGRCKWLVDLDMRESVVLAENKLCLDDIAIGKKFKAIVTRVEDYGVFVRVDNSECSGLVHKSECSDDFVKNPAELYDPGDVVKVLVIKKDPTKKQLGFSMKQSHFVDDDDSDDDSSVHSLTDDVAKDECMAVVDSDDDENVFSAVEHKNSSSDEGESSNADESSDEDESFASEIVEENDTALMDTDVGFDWNDTLKTNMVSQQGADSDDDDQDASGDDDMHKQGHKSRRKHAQRLREEQDIARRETALADGTANDRPETAGDFERLLAGSPNSSELWIMYMAFHMSLADIPAARKVAERAFQRIEFRQEREKMNVWSALITLELRYGTEKSFSETIDRACKHNNPKYVYLRVCEILEKEAMDLSEESLKRCDEMYAKMTKKFKDKKKVWLAHFEYLLKTNRQEEAHSLSKRAMQSLPSHKHVETMSRFAQLVFEYGKPERARTVFDGLLLKYPKRLDLLFVYVDKELKHGDLKHARELLQRQVHDRPAEGKMKLNDKQMKKLFKKWFSMEEQHGDTASQERVKDAARAYVQHTST